MRTFGNHFTIHETATGWEIRLGGPCGKLVDTGFTTFGAADAAAARYRRYGL